MATPRRARGFTLVEVLVALVIMALMAMMSWRGLDAIIRTRDISQVNLEQTMRLQTVMAQWEQDLLQVQDTHVVPALKFDGASLQMTRRRPEGMQIVVWTKQGNAWMRWESPPTTSLDDLQESYLRSLQLQANAPGMVRVLDGVSGWQLYYSVDNSWSNAQSSTGKAQPPAQAQPQPPSPPPSVPSGAPPPPAPSSDLPDGVKLALQFEDGSGWSGPLYRTIVMGPHP